MWHSETTKWWITNRFSETFINKSLSLFRAYSSLVFHCCISDLHNSHATNCHRMGCQVQLAWKCLFTPTVFRWAMLTREVGQGDLFLLCDHASLVGLCVQYYKSLCAAVTICAAVVNIQTDRYTHRQTAFHRFIWIAQPAELKTHTAIPVITDSALALHCCKAHKRINRKMRNSTPCKIVSPENFSSKVCTRD